MTEATSWTPRVLSVRIPAGERRNPIAMVRLAVGPLTMQLGVSWLKKGGLTIRLPVGDGGVPAIEADPEAWATIQKAAIGAVVRDQAAREHLFGPDLRRMDKAVLKMFRDAGVIPPPASAEVVPFKPASATPA